MAKNLSHIHKKLDRITQKLSLLDEMKNEQRERRLQTRYLAQMASTSLQLLQQVAVMQSDIAVMAREALREARESNERVAELLASGRKH